MKKEAGEPTRTILIIDGELREPGLEDIATRQEMFKSYRGEIDKRHMSNAENFDKAILTYANAGLALSITLFKDAFSGASLCGQVFLWLSWGGFLVSVLCVIASFPLSQKALLEQISTAEKTLLQFEESGMQPGPWQRRSDLATRCAAAAFSVGVLFSVVFALVSYPSSGLTGPD